MATKHPRTHLPASFLYALLCAGCYAGADAQPTSGPGEAADETGTPTGDPGGEATTGDGEAEASTGEPDDTGEPPPSAECMDARAVGRSPLRRLTRGEYTHSVRDLLGDPGLPVDLEIVDNRSGSGFTANDLTVDALSAEAYANSAEAIAEHTVTVLLPDLTACSIDDAACMRSFLLDLAATAYRRPLTADESADLGDFHATATAQWGAESGLQAALQAVLGSPFFLYHIELGEPDPDDPTLTRLTAHELASRLSYFLWQSAPDAELLDLAAAGDLHDPDVLAVQAQRMLTDAKHERAVGRFHEEWLDLDERLTDAYKDPDVFPEWTPDLESTMRKGLREFAREVVIRGDARVHTLFTAPYVFADAALAELYGLPAPDTFTKLATDPQQRTGILAQAAFLAGHAHASEASWVQRGLFVRGKVLCTPLPPPPDDVDMTNRNPDRTENPACMGCHTLMDPIGQGMDNYDALGRFSLLDAGSGLAPGKVEGQGLDVYGEFTGLSELSTRLGDSDVVRDCMARHWFRYATRRLEETADKCTVDALTTSFAAADGDIRSLMLAIITSDGFRLLRTP